MYRQKDKYIQSRVMETNPIERAFQFVYSLDKRQHNETTVRCNFQVWRGLRLCNKRVHAGWNQGVS